MSVKKASKMNVLRSLLLLVFLAAFSASAQPIQGMKTMPKTEDPVVLGEKVTRFDDDEDDNDEAVATDNEEEAWVKEAKDNLNKYDKDDNYDLNDLIVGIELYVWNRVSDLLDIVRCGIGGGPSVGFEIAITDYLSFGGYYSHFERGIDFPHCLPPLWLINYYDRIPVLHFHETGDDSYGTASFGPWRYENREILEGENAIYPRALFDIRAELHAFFISLYFDIKASEIKDFLAGLVGLDPAMDDDRIDEGASREPADQFGRGICNILCGALEVPFNILRITEQEGDLAGISKGVGLGVWRFISREVVGVLELLTFPFGWTPIIEPEYVFQKKRGVVWRVNRPAFRKAYR